VTTRPANGIVAYGTYIPYHRLQRSRIAEALGTAPAKGARAVAGYDEDTTSLGVEAARHALRALKQDGPKPAQVLFATSSPAYLDKTNATAIHAALGLDGAAGAYDFVGSVRSGMGALNAAADSSVSTLVVLSDIRTGLPGGADEAQGGDAAAAFVFAPASNSNAIATIVSRASASAEFLDRWRLPSEPTSRQWEERFGEHAYLPLVEAALTDALKQAGITTEEVDHLVVAGTHARAARRIATDDLLAQIGNTGTAHPGLVLADALDRADPGQTIVLVTLADGADVLVLRKGDTAGTPKPTTRQQIAQGSDDLPYATFLTWRGQLRREPPRRPDPERPAAPPTFRREDWKFAFTGSRCEACGTRHLPPQRVCVHCHQVDHMAPERLADVPATVATFTVDRLAFSLSPPVVAAVVDFDGGGRFQCELTDVDPGSVKIGDRVEMTFRKLFTADGVHNYFWKARPIRSRTEEE
jgi:hydroxymethylglutaryl-CoA synthase